MHESMELVVEVDGTLLRIVAELGFHDNPKITCVLIGLHRNVEDVVGD